MIVFLRKHSSNSGPGPIETLVTFRAARAHAIATRRHLLPFRFGQSPLVFLDSATTLFLAAVAITQYEIMTFKNNKREMDITWRAYFIFTG